MKFLNERPWWLPTFCVLSLVIHLAVGYESRLMNVARIETASLAAPPPGEVEVQFAPPAATPKPTPSATALIHAPPAAIVRRARPDVKPLRRVATAHGKRAVTDFLSVHSAGVPNAVRASSTPDRVPIVRANPSLTPPAIDDAAPALGARDGRYLAADPVARRPVTLPPTPPRPLPMSDTATGQGGGGGPALPVLADAAPNAPAPGATDQGGSGPGNGGGSGAGAGATAGAGNADGPGNRAGGSSRGAPFGDPNGVVGGNLNGGSSSGTAGRRGNGGAGGDGGDGPVHIVYVLDKSESMDDDGKIDKVRAALHKSLHELRPEDTFALIAFAQSPELLTNGLESATPGHIAEADTIVDKIQLDMGTNVSAALDLALGIADTTQVYLMSDGEPNFGITDSARLRSYVRARDGGHVTISTFALGIGEQFPGVQLLRGIAADNRGTYLYVDLHRKRRRLFH